MRGSATFTEQLMPYEIFSWQLFAATYTITCYIHDTDTIAFDDDENKLLAYTIDLTSHDRAIFIRDVYTGLTSVIIIDQSNNFIDPRAFKILIDDVRIYDDTFTWNDTLNSKNITITDLFDNILHQNTTAEYSRFYEVTISIWNLKIFNLDSDPIHVFIEQSNRNISEWIVQYNIEEFYLQNGTYNFYIFYTDLDENDDWAVENGTYYFIQDAAVISDTLLLVQSDDVIAIQVAVDVPQPADPVIDIEVVENNTDVIEHYSQLEEGIQAVREEQTFLGSFLAFSLLLIIIVVILALFVPQRYDQLKDRVKKGQVKIYEFGDRVEDQYFPELRTDDDEEVLS